MRRALSSFARSARAFRDVFGNPDLRRVELAFVSSSAAEWGSRVAMLVFAYQGGGAAAAATIGVVPLIPAAVFAPLGSTLGDRYRRERVLLAGHLAQALAMGAIARVSGYLLIFRQVAVFYLDEQEISLGVIITTEVRVGNGKDTTLPRYTRLRQAPGDRQSALITSPISFRE